MIIVVAHDAYLLRQDSQPLTVLPINSYFFISLIISPIHSTNDVEAIIITQSVNLIPPLATLNISCRPGISVIKIWPTKITNEINNGNNTQYNTERLNELETLILEKEREIFEQESQLEEEHYNERTTYLQQMYDQQMALEEQKLLELQLLQDKWGGGTEDYNAAMKRLEIQRDTFEEQKEITRQYYDELIAQQEENSALAIQLEMEKNAAITALEMEQQKKEIEIEKEKSQRKINIAKSYISAYQNVMGGISDVLGQVMSTMNESSEEYKQLAITQGIINTASGTLGAFMSGVNSGIPAPYNLILAGVMAATTLAI